MDKYNLDDLNTQTTFDVPPTTPPSATEGVSSTVASMISGLEKEKATEEATVKTQQDPILKLMETLGSEGQIREAIYQKEGGDEAKKQATYYTNLLMQEQLAMRRQLEKTRTSFGGTTAGLQDELGRIERESLSKQADIAVSQMMWQGQYADAEAIADRKVKLLLEPKQTELDIRKYITEKAEGKISDREKKIWDLKTLELERTIEKEKNNLKEVQDTALELGKNGAPQAIVQKALTATNMKELMAIPGAGKYLMSFSDRLSKLKLDEAMKSSGVGKLTTEQRNTLLKDSTAKQASARIGVISALNDYAKKVEKLKGPDGIFDPNRLTKLERKELETALNTTVGSAINVAQGQGAMGNEEAERILGNLRVSRLKRTKAIVASAQGAIDAQKSLLDNDLSFIESGMPGATAEFELFNEYKANFASDPIQKKQAKTKLEINTFKENNYSDSDIKEFYKSKYPEDASLIDNLYNLGYSLDEIISNL
jgi:hypothetical protein